MDLDTKPAPADVRPKPSVVHEAETQRQHIRINLPIELETEAGSFRVENWSVGGIGIRNLSPSMPVGSSFQARLVFPLQGFSFGMPVSLQVKHVTNGITGCSFADVDGKQLSVLQFLVGSYMAGRLVSSDEILAITSRNNFDKARNAPRPPQRDLYQAVSGFRRVLAIAVLIFLGLALIAFVGTAIYERLFVQTFDGAISTPSLSIIRAPVDGAVQVMNVQGFSQVKKGDAIGTITDAQNQATPLVSPCDCIVLGTPVSQGMWVHANSTLALVAPDRATVMVEMRVPVRQSASLGIGDRVTLHYYNGKSAKHGTVTSVQRFTPTSNSAEGGATTLESYSLIQIAPDEADTLSDFGEPVRITYDRLQLFAGKAADPVPATSPPAAN